MLDEFLKMFWTLTPLIFTGIANMFFCKSSLFMSLNRPIDCNVCLKDNRRLFGDNKTIKGFLGYIIIMIISQIIFSLINKLFQLEEYNYLYVNHNNALSYNIIVGFLLGFVYAIFELPNSFFKRRIGISPGENPEGVWKYFFIIIDQIDSLVGCVLIICLLYKFNIGFYLRYLLYGGIIHLLLNRMLYIIKLKKNKN